MIDPTAEQAFPNNVVNLLCLPAALPSIDPDMTLLKRPLRPSDPNYALGIYGTLWTPNDDSQEMRGVNAGEPTLSSYQIGIQTLVKDGDIEKGLAISSILAKRIRAVLYRNQPLRVALQSLYVQDGAFRESARRWGARSQRYMSNDIEGTFVTISVLDLWIETEMT